MVKNLQVAVLKDTVGWYGIKIIPLIFLAYTGSAEQISKFDFYKKILYNYIIEIK
jgi:hypothetical protein